VTPAPEPTIARCVVGFKDWTKRDRCGQDAACELRLLHNGRPRVFRIDGKGVQWRPACYHCASGLLIVVGREPFGDGWTLEERPQALLREVLDHRADVIPLHAGRNGDTT
jgi:hypothetical protein